jgi:hypothetical protein
MNWVQIAGWGLVALVLAYLVWKFYQTQADFTYMTHNDRGFKRALKGRGFILDPEEFIVRGSSAPKIEFVALDPSTGQRKMTPLLDQRSGRVNLRPQYCVPMPFAATTEEGHAVVVTSRVQFSLNRDKMFFVYHVQDFATALETRIQSAVRAEVGKRTDEKLRAGLREVEDGALKTLRQAEEDGDEEHEMGIALGVKFHSVSFEFTTAKNFARGLGGAAAAVEGQAPGEGALAAVATLGATGAARVGPLSIDPLDMDAIADQFSEQRRSPASTAAFLALVELQVRQNIAEALAGSGQLIVLTPQELGLTGADAVQHLLRARPAPAPAATTPQPGQRP